MAINVNSIWQLLNTLAVKGFRGGYDVPEFNTILPTAEIFYQNKLLGNLETSSGNRNVDNYFANSSQEDTDRLKPFIVNLTLYANSQGRIIYPADYNQIINCSYDYYTQVGQQTVRQTKPYDALDSGQKTFITGSYLFQPNDANRKMEQMADYIQLYPEIQQYAQFQYYRMPVPAFLGVTYVNNVPVYNPATSRDSEFPQDCLNVITFIVANMLGISIESPDLINFTQSKLKEGV